MPAYLIVEHKITDSAKFQEYGSKVVPLIAQYGGRVLTKGGSHRILETTLRQLDRVVVFEFPDMARLNAWYGSAENQPLIPLRQSAVDLTKDVMIAIDGA